MTIAASFTPKPAILSFAITHELLTMRLFLDSLANNNFRMKEPKIRERNYRLLLLNIKLRPSGTETQYLSLLKLSLIHI